MCLSVMLYVHFLSCLGVKTNASFIFFTYHIMHLAYYDSGMIQTKSTQKHLAGLL